MEMITSSVDLLLPHVAAAIVNGSAVFNDMFIHRVWGFSTLFEKENLYTSFHSSDSM